MRERRYGTDDADVAELALGRLAHLLRAVAQRHDAFGLKHLRDGKIEVHVVLVIEVVDDVSRNLHVLDLIFANRNVRRVVHHNVRCHQHWVREETQDIRKHVLLSTLRHRARRLLLELVHSQQTIDVHIVFKNPTQLTVVRILGDKVQSVYYVRLDEQHRFVVWLQSASQEGQKSVAHLNDHNHFLLYVVS